MSAWSWTSSRLGRVSRAPDAFVRKQVYDERALNGNLAGKAGIPKAVGQLVVPVGGRRRLCRQAYATGRTEPPPAAVYVPRETGIGRQPVVQQHPPQVGAVGGAERVPGLPIPHMHRVHSGRIRTRERHHAIGRQVTQGRGAAQSHARPRPRDSGALRRAQWSPASVYAQCPQPPP